jgi:phosphomannomutase
MVTGRDLPRDQNGVMIFNKVGNLISKEVTEGIEKAMNEYIKSQYYLVDMSPLFDYSAKKVRFKPDNFTDMTMKSYI